MYSLTTVIAKPTKDCNAQCDYCSTPPDGVNKWSLDDFKRYFDAVEPFLAKQALWLWHGGEPMLMGPDFYAKAWEYASQAKPELVFSMQSNILGYSTHKWKDVLMSVFKGSLSTSYDPDETHRKIKGSAQTYSRIFYDRLEKVLSDGFFPTVIGTYTQLTMPMAFRMYDEALAKGERTFNLRFNYRYPVGRDFGHGEMLTPETYGRVLVELYDRWLRDVPGFMITPLDEMLASVLQTDHARCPWTNSCGGHFISIEPDGAVHNCAEFASLGNNVFEETGVDTYQFGNLNTHTLEQLMASKPARDIRRRRIALPTDCTSCEHFAQCGGGCARDAVLYEHGLGGKFHYCHSWMVVFDRIKESIRTGEAEGIISRFYGLTLAEAQARMATRRTFTIKAL